MKPTFFSKLRHWTYQLFRGCLQGGAVAVKAFAAAASASAAGFTVKPLDLKEAAAVFVGAAILHAWDFISKTPLPDDIESDVDLLNVSEETQRAITEKAKSNETLEK